jgi:hypothetical protein
VSVDHDVPTALTDDIDEDRFHLIMAFAKKLGLQ